MDDMTKAADVPETTEHAEYCDNTYEAPAIREVDPAGVLYAVLN